MKQTIQELSTQASDVRGSALSTSYQLQPVEFLRQIVDGAKKRWFFRNTCKVLVAPKGTKDVIQPKRTIYFDHDDISYDSSTPTAGAADITATTVNTMAAVTFTPAPFYAQVQLENYALSVSSLNLVEYARDELIHSAGDKVDVAIATALRASTNQSDSNERGAQIVYGGDARRDSELAAGDVLTTDMVAEAKRKLQSTTCTYWPATAGSEANSSQSKNPWTNADGAFVLHIAPEQEEVLMKDSQFINAAEYGSQDIVLNGEIGKYLGVKVVVTNNTPAYATTADSPDGESSGNPGVIMHRCIMVVSTKAAGICYGISETPTLQVFQHPNRDETRINLLLRYHAAVIHSDAIVFMDVADS